MKELLSHERQVRLPQPRDDSGRAKFEAMCKKIIAKATEDVKRLVEKTLKLHLDTVTADATSTAPETPIEKINMSLHLFDSRDTTRNIYWILLEFVPNAACEDVRVLLVGVLV